MSESNDMSGDEPISFAFKLDLKQAAISFLKFFTVIP